MEEKKNVHFEEILESEIDDIWDIFFPYMSEGKEKLEEIDLTDQHKPRRYLKFLTM